MVGQSRCSKIPSLHILSIYIACLKKDSKFRTSDFKNIGGGRVEPWVDRSRRLLSIYFVQVKYMYAFFFYVSTNGVLQMGVGGGVFFRKLPLQIPSVGEGVPDPLKTPSHLDSRLLGNLMGGGGLKNYSGTNL